jgi:hypothetical protein
MMNRDTPAKVATGAVLGRAPRFFWPLVSTRAVAVRAVSVRQMRNGRDHHGQTLNNCFRTTPSSVVGAVYLPCLSGFSPAWSIKRQ